MARFMLLVLLFAVTVPSLAKPRNKKQPIPCSDLWSAVTEALGNTGNYKIVAVNNETMKANFIVVGAVFPAMNRVQLRPQAAGGCELDLRIGFTGADDDGAFRSRVHRALKKLNAARASADPGSAQAQ